MKLGGQFVTIEPFQRSDQFANNHRKHLTWSYILYYNISEV